MTKEEIYEQLESQMLSYDDYAAVPTIECGEQLVAIKNTPGVIASKVRADAIPITGTETYVREGTLRHLEQAAGYLAVKMPGAVLDVGYGYRALSVQKTRYAGVLTSLRAVFEGEELRQAAHRQVAIPEIAGHPAGAAVDIAISIDGQLLDFGTELWNFSKDSYTFSPYVNSEARMNREVLLDCMVDAGFAPFYGEWWHFSYGDKEWAAFYEQPNAIYDQLEFRAPNITTL